MSIYDKKYQIFISSTYTDLIKAREEVIRVILSLYQIPIGMEMFSADNEEQWQVIKSTIQNCDYYILIVGHRYGSVTKEGVSYTEKEFDFAKANGIPIMSFVRERNIATVPNEREKEVDKMNALDVFLSKVLNNSMCDFWENEQQLGQKIAIALTKIFFKNPQLGWIRASEVNPIQTTEELTKLSQENRTLREELLRLKSSVMNEAPKIEVSINQKAQVLTLKCTPFVEFLEINEELVSGDLRSFVSKADIDAYNKELEEKHAEIQIYKEEYLRYDNILHNHTELVVEISNTGTAKANDIYIDILFPKEIYLSERDEIERLTTPTKPTILTNPIEKAIAMKNREQTFYNQNRWINRKGGVDSLSSAIILPKIKNLAPRNFWIDKEKNSLSIRLSKLTHTRVSIIKEDIVIAPTKKGNFEIVVSTVCDEFRIAEKNTIPIVVV